MKTKNSNKSIDEFCEKVDRLSTHVAAQLSRAMIIPGLTPKESITIFVGAICKTIQVVARVAGLNPQKLGEAISESISKYFAIGGDPRLDDITRDFKDMN